MRIKSIPIGCCLITTIGTANASTILYNHDGFKVEKISTHACVLRSINTRKTRAVGLVYNNDDQSTQLIVFNKNWNYYRGQMYIIMINDTQQMAVSDYHSYMITVLTGSLKKEVYDYIGYHADIDIRITSLDHSLYYHQIWHLRNVGKAYGVFRHCISKSK